MQIKPSQQLSVVIPMFNEEENVEPLLHEVHAALAEHPDFEIIVVDDGSKDATYAKLSELAQNIPQLRPIQHNGHLGQSVGLVSGIRAASKPWIVTLDGDGQNDPADIPKLIQVAESNHTTGSGLLLAGHRVNRKDSQWKKIGSRFANKIRRWFLRDGCPDTACGIKMFSRDTFLSLPHFKHMHRYFPALFKRMNAQVINVPVNHRPRMRGKSKYGNWGRLKVGIVDLFGVAWLIRRFNVPELKNDNKS